MVKLNKGKDYGASGSTRGSGFLSIEYFPKYVIWENANQSYDIIMFVSK